MNHHVFANIDALYELTLDGFFLSACSTKALLEKNYDDIMVMFLACQPINSGGQLESLEMINCLFGTGAVQNIAGWLETNTGLQYFQIEGRELQYENFSQILQSIVAHPSLTSLDIGCALVGPRFLQALQQVLTCENCRLTTLALKMLNTGSEFCMAAFVQLFDHNTCPLTTLKVQCQLSSAKANLLLRELHRCPTLRHLDLSGNCFSYDWHQMTQGLHLWMQSVLETLTLDRTPRVGHLMAEYQLSMSVTQAITSALIRLLDAFPKLGSLRLQMDKIVGLRNAMIPNSLIQKMDENCWGISLFLGRRPIISPSLHCERYHLKDSRGDNFIDDDDAINIKQRISIPILIWPYVMAKITEEEQQLADHSPSCFYSWRAPNALYHLVQGPAFLSRSALPV